MAADRAGSAAASLAAAEPGGTPAGAGVPLLVFVHGSAQRYGADKVLYDLAVAARGWPAVAPLVALHEDGPLVDALRQAGVEVHVADVGRVSRAVVARALRPAAWRHALRRGGGEPGARTTLDTVVAGRRVGLVYANTLAVAGAAWWARRRGHRLLWHVHEIVLRPAAARCGLPWLVALLADAVVCNSAATQRWLCRAAPTLAARSRVVVNGLAPADAPPAADVAAFRARAGAGADEVLVTLAGRLNRWKGQPLLIDAFALLRDQGRLGALRAAIVGDAHAEHGDVAGALRGQVERLGLADRVGVLPFETSMAAAWHASDIAVVPSLEPEPFGIVAIEAMAAGRPVLAAGHGGLCEIVVPEVTGMLVPPGDVAAWADAIARLAADPGLRRRWGRAGRERQRAVFALQTQVDATRARVESLLRAR